MKSEFDKVSFPGGYLADDLVVGETTRRPTHRGEGQRSQLTAKVFADFFAEFFANPKHGQHAVAMQASGSSLQAAALTCV